MSKVLVTGSQGQLGQEFQKLAGSKFDFADRKGLDISNFELVRNFIEEGNYDFVINCAAYTAVDKAEDEPLLCEKVNVEAVRNLANACLENDSTLVHVSSDYVYHASHEIPLDEEENCHPKGVYAQSKLAGEDYIRQIMDKYYIIRTSWVYSSYGQNFVKTMLRLASTRSELNVVADQIGSPTYAADLGQVIIDILERGGASGTYNFSNLGFISWADFAEEIFHLKGLKMDVHRIPTTDYPTPAERPLNSRMIKSKIVDEFDIELKHWKKSLAQCLDLL